MFAKPTYPTDQARRVRYKFENTNILRAACTKGFGGGKYLKLAKNVKNVSSLRPREQIDVII